MKTRLRIGINFLSSSILSCGATLEGLLSYCSNRIPLGELEPAASKELFPVGALIFAMMIIV